MVASQDERHESFVDRALHEMAQLAAHLSQHELVFVAHSYRAVDHFVGENMGQSKMKIAKVDNILVNEV